MANPHAPEKNLPAESKENPKQKMLIWIACAVAGVALLGLGSFHLIRSRDDFSKTQTQFIDAIKAADAATLMSLASPEIQIGTAEGDNSQALSSQQMIPRILVYAKDLDWTAQADEVDQTRLLVAKSKGLQVLFRKEQDTWKWVAVLMLSADEVQALSFGTDTAQPKESYKEIQSDEALGTEEEIKE